MSRPIPAALVAGLLAGCGFMQVAQSAIPSVPGAVAATPWRLDLMDVQPTDEGATRMESLEAFFARLEASAREVGSEAEPTLQGR